MRREISIEDLVELGVVPEDGGAPALSFYTKLASSGVSLGAADYLTVRDLARLGGYDDIELHAFIVCLFLAFNEGSVCLKMSDDAIRRKLSSFLDIEIAEDLARRMSEIDMEARYPGLVSSDEARYLPLITKEIDGEKFLYFQKFPQCESRLKTSLLEFAKRDADTRSLSDTKIRAILEDVLNTHPVKMSKRAVELDNGQKMAVALSLLKNFVIISGGPGTGKTSVAITILRSLTRFGIDAGDIRITAPTGRAAYKMAGALKSGITSIGESLKKEDGSLLSISGSTIHRLLRYSPSRNRFLYNGENKLPADAVIVDEASMIDIVLMSRLFDALKPDAKIILLGDKDQLPSVEAGAVLADLMPPEKYARYSKEMIGRLHNILPGLDDEPIAESPADTPLTDRLVILRRSYRSCQEILSSAGRVNLQDLSLADSMPSVRVKRDKDNMRVEWPHSGPYFFETDSTDPGRWRGLIDSWISKIYFNSRTSDPSIKETYGELIKMAKGSDIGSMTVPDKDGVIKKLFSYTEEGKILTAVKRGLYGSYWVNRYIDRRLRPEFDRFARGKFFDGAPIMITENDALHGLYNGDVGIVLKTVDGEYRAIFDRSGEYLSFPAAELPVFELAFAITIHKSQGSEYDTVLIALPEDEESRLLTKEIIYTALTRAKRTAILCGTRAVLRKALERKTERESGIKFWD